MAIQENRYEDEEGGKMVRDGGVDGVELTLGEDENSSAIMWR